MSHVRLKYCVDSIRRGNPPSYVDADGIPVVNQGCVWPSGLEYAKLKQHNPDEKERIDAWLQNGDVLVNSTGTGTLGRVCHLDFELETELFADSHVTVLRDSKNRINTRYLFYILSIQQERITVECSEGATNQIELSRTLLGNLKVDCPKSETQIKIADYLDRKTEKLDQLIKAKTNLLKLLDEKKRTLIACTVTRGLNKDVALKDTGIHWLGKIPEHWEVERSKWLLPEVDERSEMGDEELLTVSHLTGVTKRSDKDVNMFLAESLVGYKKCNKDDLVINTLWAWMGAMGISPVNGVISPAYNVYRPSEKLLPEYLDMLVRMPNFISEITRYSKGVWSSRLRLYPEGLYEAYLPIPPTTEQQEIVDAVNKQLSKFKQLKSVTEKTITLLHERRTALVSAAVSGKLSEEELNAS